MVTSCGLSCPSAAHSGGSISFKVFHQSLLRWRWLLPGIPLPISGVGPCSTRCSMLNFLLTVIWPVSLPQLGWSWGISAVLLLLTVVIPHHYRCPTSIQHCGWVSSQISHICLLGRGVCCIVLPFFSVTLFSQVSHCRSLRWFCFASLPLIGSLSRILYC